MARKHGNDQDDQHRRNNHGHRRERQGRDDDLRFTCGRDAQARRIWCVLDLAITGTSRPTEAEIASDAYEGHGSVSRWLERMVHTEKHGANVK